MTVKEMALPMATAPPIWTSACAALRDFPTSSSSLSSSSSSSVAVSSRLSERADCCPRHFPLAITLPCSCRFASFGRNQSIRLIWKPTTNTYKWAFLHLNKRQCSHMRAGPRCMAPDEEKMTKRSPLDFPVEWDRPSPGRRPDIFPQFSPMKTPLPQPSPTDPPQEDEEEEEKKEEEEDPEKEPEKPEE